VYKLSEKENLADSYSSVFDQNVSYEEKETFKNREYFQSMHGNELNDWGKNVLFTRSQYNKEYAEIEGIYEREKKEQIKCILICFVAFVAVCVFLLIVEIIMYVKPMPINVIVRGFVAAIRVLSIVALVFFVFGLLKKIKQLKKQKIKAIKSLEIIKAEHMTNGTYDAGR
jgi:uncharacterized membrane protein